MAKQRPTWAKRMKELQQMERKQAKAAKRAEKKDGSEDSDVQGMDVPMDAASRAAMFDGLF
ncbi:MAG: hypothetical protein KC656_01085 [Myxococcales bacterium]|nr:hypothetical protein [Myxococcales bacterium]MCB9671083.1 hypothetical protein [Alphaproteobacteria bacterium]MCB9692339.1 hypothetical protein [Alphaproteobacteria bacterium]